MLSFLKKYSLFKSSKVLGVNCILKPDGESTYFWVLITCKNEKVSIEKYGFFQGNPEQLKSEVKADAPIYLSLDGKGIVTKRIQKVDGNNIIHQIIPNATADDFIIETAEGSNDSLFVSVARKNLMDEMLQSFRDLEFEIIGLTLGPFKGIKLLDIFDHLPSDFYVGSYLIQYDRTNRKILDFTKKDIVSEIYNIGESELASEYILPFYHALSYYVYDEQELKYPGVTEQFEEFAAKRVFRIVGWTCLVIAFLVLFVNVWYYMGITNEKSGLESQITGNKELLGKLKVLNEELEWKQKFLSQAGILKNSRMSFYADQLAFLLPRDIILQRLEIHPLLSKVKKEKEIELQPDKIAVDGVTEDSELLNLWINKLKKQQWVKDVSVINYSRENEYNEGTFTIEITLKN